MNDQFFKQVEAVLAVERLEAYRQDGAGTLDTLARYLWNMALCESLYSPLQMAEIALRNTVHVSLADRFTADDWYLTSGVLLPWQGKMVDEATKKLVNNGVPAAAGRMVAELHFGFWAGFFNKAHARTGVGHLLTQKVFSYAPKTERDMSRLDLRWNRIRTLRNRVFHHERIIHWKDLSAQHAAILETIGWISPELKELAVALDRFTPIYFAGIDPWKEKIRQHWPATPGDLK
jgi:hypothetical protein